MAEVFAPDITKLSTLIQACAYDANALANGNKSAATHLRKKLSQISKESTALRAQALAFQKSIQTKSRAKKPAVVEPEEPEVQDIEDLPPSPLQLKREMTSVSPEGVPSTRGRKPRTARKPRRTKRSGL